MKKTAALLLFGASITVASSGAVAIDCAPTESDSLGPFFVSGMPVTSSLVRSSARIGEPLLVLGQVLSAEAPHVPIASARLEAWQTDGEGDYFPANNGPASNYKDEELDLRGTVVTDQIGFYRYDTLNPGAYYPRPKHIHYIVSAPGFKQLVTQHYLGEVGQVPNVPCRNGVIERSSGTATFSAPPIYLETSR